MSDLVRTLAAWALLHESADDGWKAAVARGRRLEPGAPEQGPQAFVDGLAALVAEEKDRLRAELAGGASGPRPALADLGGKLDALAFEISELRGRVESLQASVDAMAARGKD